MVDTPFVSVIVPTFRRPQFLIHALRSVQHQTYDHFEVFVINDHPPTRSEVDAVVESFGDERFQVIHHASPRGGNAARNTGIRGASGSLIAMLDDDDFWMPTKLERHVEIHVDRENTDIVYSDAFRIADEDEHSPWIHRAPLPSDPILNAMREARWCPAIMSAVTIRARCFLQCGGFDERMQSFQDWDMWFRLAHHFSFVRIAEPLSVFRIHAGVRTSINLEKRLTGMHQIVKKWEKEIDTERFERKYGQAAFYKQATQALINKGRAAALDAVTGIGEYIRGPKDLTMGAKLVAVFLMGGRAYTAYREKRRRYGSGARPDPAHLRALASIVRGQGETPI